MTHCEQIEMLGYPLHFWSSSLHNEKNCLHKGARHRGTRSIRVCLLASTPFCGEKTIFEEKARECVHYWVLQPGGLGAGNSFALKLQCYSCFSTIIWICTQTPMPFMICIFLQRFIYAIHTEPFLAARCTCYQCNWSPLFVLSPLQLQLGKCDASKKRTMWLCRWDCLLALKRAIALK